jgi:hypothetical protein
MFVFVLAKILLQNKKSKPLVSRETKTLLYCSVYDVRKKTPHDISRSYNCAPFSYTCNFFRKLISSKPLQPQDAVEEADSKDYVFAMRVSPNRRLIGVRTLVGSTIEEAGLRNIPGTRVVGVTRVGQEINRDIGHNFVLEADDILWCCSRKEGLSGLRRVPGLQDVDHAQVC